MRLLTYRNAAGVEGVGALLPKDEAHVLKLRSNSLQALIEAGPREWDAVRKSLETPPAEAVLARKDLTLLAPLPRPIRMRDFSVFESHAALQGKIKLAQVWYEQPVYYKCNHLAVVGPDHDVIWPAGSNEIDYELEFAAIIGIGGKDISRAGAGSHIFGYTIFNDLSARDWQLKEMGAGLGPARGKDFDGSNVLGPVVVTADEIGNPYDLTMTARVNGVEWSRGSSSDMRYRFDEIIAFLSQSETLYPGEVLGSGTVGGGCGLELGRFPQRGDLVELEVERIGCLRTRIL